MALVLGGCESMAYHYDYQGVLFIADKTPAVGVKVSVQASVELSQWIKNAPRSDLLDGQDSTFTDEEGRFNGVVNGDGTYTQWLSIPVRAAPKLNGIYVWIFRQSEWSPIYVPLTDAAQTRGYSGGRHVDLPTIVLPSQ
jgi:hypothetical protein